MGAGFTNLLKYSLLIDSRNGWYYSQRIAMALSVILSFFIAQNSYGTANGLEYLSYIFNFGFFITTFTACHIFSNSIVEDKENGVLPLIIMTGASSASIMLSKFATKFCQLSYLLLVLIPPTLFSVTLGGVTWEQVILLYVYLILWLLFVSMAAMWISVFFAEAKEAAVMTSFTIISSFLMLWLFQASPLSSINQIIRNSSSGIFSFHEIYLYFGLSVYFFYSGCKNLHFGVLFPIKFIDDYFQKLKIDTFKSRIKNYKNQKIRIRFPRRLPIVAKDKYLIPFKPLINMTPVIGILLFISIIIIPVLLIFFIWILFGPFYLTIKRVVDVFSLELEENTFSSLLILPMTPEELLQEKIKSACPYASVFVAYTLIAIIMLFIIMASESFFLFISALFLPGLYFQMIYSTLFIVFKSREMTRITSYIICLFLIMLYFTVPYVSIMFAPAFWYTRKLCLKEMVKVGEISD